MFCCLGFGYIYVCVFLCVRMMMYLHFCACMHISAYVCTFLRMYVHYFAYDKNPTLLLLLSSNPTTYAEMYIRRNTHTYAEYAEIQIHTYADVHIHTYTYTYV